MSDPSFFKEEGTFSEKSSQEEHLYKRPEFILIDDQHEKKQYTYFSGDSSKKPLEEEKEGEPLKQGALSPRFLCFVGFIFCLVFGLGMLIWASVLTFLAVCSFFQNRPLNESVGQVWKLYMHTVIAGLGFTIGLLSPALGLSLIALYFSLVGEMTDSPLLRKIFRGSFNQF